MRVLLAARPALGAALVLAGGAAGRPARAEEPGAGPGPFLAASIGGGELGDASPGLNGGALGLRGHLELGYGDGRFVSGALSLALARSSYASDIPPPEMVVPEGDLELSRVGIGAVGEGRLPLGRAALSVGAGAFVDRMNAVASGSLLGIRGDYFQARSVAIGLEARTGVDLRIHPVVTVGLRAGWGWCRADLDELTGGAAWLSGPWLELRITLDASGFRMTSAPPL